ncbi:hypothetical protein EMCRGX_G002430 [Ephydatia muelleri]
MEKNKKTRKCLSVLERLKLVDEIKQDQGIIAALKVWYKSSLLARLVETDEDISRLQSLAQQLPAGSAGLKYGAPPHVRDALVLLKDAWDNISSSTIAACWSLSQLTCEGLRLCLRTIKLSTTGNKATLVQRLLEHEDSHDPEHQQMDDSSSGSRDREIGDRALTDGPAAAGTLVGLEVAHSQGLAVLDACDHGRSGGPRDSECPPKDPVVVDAPGGVTIRLALPLQMRSSSSHAGNADPSPTRASDPAPHPRAYASGEIPAAQSTQGSLTFPHSNTSKG